MRETVRAFRERTGIGYAPPERVRGIARALGEDEPCPTLFRYPGPCGLREHFGLGLRRLAPPASDLLWMGEPALHADVLGARHFGTLAVLEPLRLSPCESPREGLYLAANLRFDDPEGIVWVPPSRLLHGVPWDRVRTRTEAVAWLGPRYRGERGRAMESLHAYLEEIATLERTGARGPRLPWCEVSLEQRLRTIAEHGARPCWSGRLCGELPGQGRIGASTSAIPTSPLSASS